MADVRMNGRRVPALGSIPTLDRLLSKLEGLGHARGSFLTALSVNGRDLDLETIDSSRIRLGPTDTVSARMEGAEQLAFESLQVARDMAELLVFDLKVATLHLWENLRSQEKQLLTLLRDCQLFLQLAANPLELLGKQPQELEPTAQQSLAALDELADRLEETVLLAVHGHGEDAAQVLVARVRPAIERWIDLSTPFAETLGLESTVIPDFRADFLPLPPRQP